MADESDRLTENSTGVEAADPRILNPDPEN
jgi:hypothetical protein